jgi:hypothetical protein
VNPSRVTWLVLGTTLVLVLAVVVAALLFINGGSQRFPRGTGGGGSGIAHLRPAGGGANRGHGPGRTRLASSPAGGAVAAHPAVAGLAVALGPGADGAPGAHGPGGRGGPPGQQYSSSLDQLNAKLWGR